MTCQTICSQRKTTVGKSLDTSQAISRINHLLYLLSPLHGTPIFVKGALTSWFPNSFSVCNRKLSPQPSVLIIYATKRSHPRTSPTSYETTRDTLVVPTVPPRLDPKGEGSHQERISECGTFGSPRDVRFVLGKGGRVSRESYSLGWSFFFRSCHTLVLGFLNILLLSADKVSGTGTIVSHPK